MRNISELGQGPSLAGAIARLRIKEDINERNESDTFLNQDIQIQLVAQDSMREIKNNVDQADIFMHSPIEHT